MTKANKNIPGKDVKSRNEQLKADLLTTIEELQRTQAEMEECLENINRANDELNGLIHNSRMQEMNQSLSMQYLVLQQKMQDESRRFTLLSNIMKTKHDTAKNSISNLR